MRDDFLTGLASVPLFSKCTKRQLEEVGRVADALRFPAGEQLMRQGQPGRELVVVLEGTAEVWRDGEHVADVGPGGFVGEMAVLTAAPRNATVVAGTQLDVLVMTHRSLDQLLDDVPGLAKHLLYEVAERLAPSTT